MARRPEGTVQALQAAVSVTSALGRQLVDVNILIGRTVRVRGPRTCSVITRSGVGLFTVCCVISYGDKYAAKIKAAFKFVE